MVDAAFHDTYPLRAAVRLTGLSEHTIRAWERRHAAVRPQRTAAGTRRYTDSDIERLQLLAALVQGGERIGSVAGLSIDELRSSAARGERFETGTGAGERALAAVSSLDFGTAEELLTSQLSLLGHVRFAREMASPLLTRVGDAWQSGRLSIAVEHMTSGLIRSLLGGGLRKQRATGRKTIVFATPAGERHEIGLLSAALTAQAAGADALYLGADLPASEATNTAARTKARALAVSIVSLERREAETEIARLHSALDDDCELWIGGYGADGLEIPAGIHLVPTLEALETRVGLLAFEPS
jgi:DNA-binding transcriptional MerR regulator